LQWGRQRSKGARSFRGQNILEPGHPDVLFSSKKVDDLFLVVELKTQAANTITEAKQSNRQGGARAVDLPAKSFDLAPPGVAPPLPACAKVHHDSTMHFCFCLHTYKNAHQVTRLVL